ALVRGAGLQTRQGVQPPASTALSEPRPGAEPSGSGDPRPCLATAKPSHFTTTNLRRINASDPSDPSGGSRYNAREALATEFPHYVQYHPPQAVRQPPAHHRSAL